jgi:hypothetical protein
MTTNPYIINYSNKGEQDLAEGITIEIIQAMGQDCLYIPREYLSIDKYFNDIYCPDILDFYEINAFDNAHGCYFAALNRN